MAQSFATPAVTYAPYIPLPASATAAYNAWLAGLGVADTLNSLNGDDLCVVFNGVLFDATASTVRTFFDTEGGLGMFYIAPADETKKVTPALSLAPATRNYSTVSEPNLLVRCSDLAYSDHGTTSSRMAVSGSTLIVFARISQNSAPASYAVDVAFRVQPGSVDIVATNISATNACIYVYALALSNPRAYPIATAFTGTVAHTISHSKTSGQVATMLLTDIASILAKYDPTQAKIPLSLYANDLRDRLPHGVRNEVTNSANFNPWEMKGWGQITGTVKNKGMPDTPVYRLLRLYREPGGALVDSTWSNATTGAYSFTGIPMRYTYTVISYDHTGTYRAVIADNQTPELMP